MRIGIALLVFLFCACQTVPKKAQAFNEAQQLIEQTVAKHPNLVRLTIHAVPTGETVDKIIACNVREKLGKISDPEDIEARTSKKTTVLHEGNNLDVTAPILDKAGQAIAATGITLAIPPNTGEEALVKEAQAIAQELTTAIQTAGHPLW